MVFLILLLISVSVCTAYLLIAKKVTGRRQPSISNTYYTGMGWWFLAFCVGTGLPLLPVLMEYIPDPWKIFCLLAIFGIIGCGCAPKFLDDQKKEHYSFAILCLTCAILVLAAVKMWWVMIPCFAVCAYMVYRDRKWMYWLEIAAIYSVFISLGILVIKSL